MAIKKSVSYSQAAVGRLARCKVLSGRQPNGTAASRSNNRGLKLVNGILSKAFRVRRKLQAMEPGSSIQVCRLCICRQSAWFSVIIRMKEHLLGVLIADVEESRLGVQKGSVSCLI